MIRRLWEHFAVQAGILAVVMPALALRLWGIRFDLPNLYHPDEYRYVTMALNILKTGDYNPHFFNYPSLFFYIQAIAYIPYFLLYASRGLIKGVEGLIPPTEVVNGDVALAAMPSQFILGRMVTVLFAVGTVLLVYLIGAKVYGRRVGLVAGLLLALSYTHVRISHFITPDVLAAFFVALAALLNYEIVVSGRARDYLLGGLAIGLAASTKYNAGAAVVLLIIAHLLRKGRTRLIDSNLAIGLAACLAAFLVGTPYMLLDLPTFLNGLAYEMRHYSAPVAPYEVNSAFAWYAAYLWTREGVVAVLAAVQIVRAFLTRSRRAIYLSSFALLYFVFVCSYTVRNDRTLAPLLPLMCILAAVALCDLIKAVAIRLPLRGSKAGGAAVALVALCLAILVPASNILALNRAFTQPDVRTEAAAWVERTLPAGSRIVVESYSPLMLNSVHRLQWVRWASDHTIEWYRQNADYVFLHSRDHYATIARNPTGLAREAALYQAIFDQFELVGDFSGSWVGLSAWVRVYKVR